MGEDKRGEAEEWAQEIEARFVQSFVSEIASKIGQDSEQVIDVNRRIREWLDQLDRSAGSRAEFEPVGKKHDKPSRSSAPELQLSENSDDDKEILGRNLLSKLREIVILDQLSRETRAFALHEVQSHASAKGFEDSGSAVISQLHRLNQNDVITKPGNGMYVITADGRQHLARLKDSYGSVLEDWLKGRGAGKAG